MHSTVYFLAWCKCFIFSIAEKFKCVQYVSKIKKTGALGIQVCVKCQGLFIFNATRDERLKEKSLKYCMFFSNKELG